MLTLQLPVSSQTWRLTFRDDTFVPLVYRYRPAPSVDPRAAAREAVENPAGFVPVRQALTPDDRVAVAVDPSLPQVGELLAGLLDALAEAGVSQSNVTLVTPPGSPEDWWEDLPDEIGDVHVERHDPDTAERHSYLANSKADRRIYLNRTLVDADAVIVLTARRYDPLRGPTGGADGLFPTYSNAETRAELIDRFVPGGPPAGDGESAEVANMLGIPVFVQVIEGNGHSIAAVIAGLVTSSAEAESRRREIWDVRIENAAKTVVVSVGGNGFDATSRALACAARAVEPGGRIVLLGGSVNGLPEAAEVIRESRTPSQALERLLAEKPAGWQSAFGWCGACQRARLFMHGDITAELAEELFAVVVENEDEINRLLDADGEVVLLPEADKAWASIGNGE